LDDKTFALITVTVSGVFAIIVAVVTHWFSSSREARVLQREVRRDEIAVLRQLYEEAIFILDHACRTRNFGTKEDQNRVIRFLARLHLYSPSYVRDQYHTTSDVVDAWTAQVRSSEPESRQGILIFRAGAEAEKAKAQEAWPAVEQELTKLKKQMKKHLTELASDLTTRSS
jgi:hypothetical protein